MKTKVIRLAVLLALFATATIYAQEPAIPERSGEEMVAVNFAHRNFPGERHNNLFTEEQKSAIKQIRMKSMKEAKPLKDRLRELNAHYQTLVTAEKADMNAIYSNIEKTDQLETELAKIKEKANQDVRALLTEEQLLRFDSRKGRMAARQGMKGKRPGTFRKGHMKRVRSICR